MAGLNYYRFVNRENRVPYYQRLFFEADKKHIRLWETTHRSRFMLYPYYFILWGGLAGMSKNLH
ncbi:hypothetical protein GcM3_202006 [Golovinomyces cichoracearum]|uniref:Uncharacterized protein n=1 Tax=Golovinomyces cichoracearum TaxID=62708 RepID=A0A420HD26_9PEZI|nr:hypothetical protein GcM3_202006 [Golovinomyces cichoracearum]